jgi:DNA-binding NtrC family response regulator
MTGGPKEDSHMAAREPIEADGGVLRTVTVLSVDPIANDHRALRQIFSRSEWSPSPHAKWSLTASPSAESAIATIRQHSIPVLLCGCDHQPDTWKEMLEVFAGLPHPPLLIVTSRIADERLWAEALNLGAHDVLAKPFDADEVTRVVSSAWLNWKARDEQTRRLPAGLDASRPKENRPILESRVRIASTGGN